MIDLNAEQSRQKVDFIKGRVTDIWQTVIELYQGRAWLSLGYDSWDALCASEFDGSELKLPREDRREIVGSLREAGLSQRAIASATSTPRATIQDDLRQVDGNRPRDIPSTSRTISNKDTPAVADDQSLVGGPFGPPTKATGVDQRTVRRDQVRQNASRDIPSTSRTIPNEAVSPAPVTGLDGKKYAPTKSRSTKKEVPQLSEDIKQTIIAEVANANNLSLDNVTGSCSGDVGKISEIVKAAINKYPDADIEVLRKGIREKALSLVKDRNIASRRDKAERANVSGLAVSIESCLQKCREDLTGALNTFRKIDSVAEYPEDFLNGHKQSINDVIALAGLVKNAFGGSVSIDWDSELEKLGTDND